MILKNTFRIFMSIIIGNLAVFSFKATAIDFTIVTTPFYAETTATGPDGINPVLMEMRYDGNNNSSLTLPPPPGALGKLRLVGNHKTSEYFFWVENDPRKTIMTMNEKQFAESLGVDLSLVKSKGTKKGSKTIIGEACTVWRVDVSIIVHSKDAEGFFESCVTDDNIELKGTHNGKVLHEMTKLQRGPQPQPMFELPSGWQVVDMNKIMEQLKSLQK
jgi:hypothetical protein